MPLKMPLKHITTTGVERKHTRLMTWLYRVWLIGTGTTITYFLLVYVLPIFGLISTSIVPFKVIVEWLICLVPVVSGMILTVVKIEKEPSKISIDDGILFVNTDEQVIGVCCLEITSASGSVYTDEFGRPKYNSSMLLAIRSGMNKYVNMAFEVGVVEGNPFLRIFITTKGVQLDSMKEILRREATRVEAILLASLNLVELKLLENNDLSDAVYSVLDNSDPEGLVCSNFTDIMVLSMKGIPSVKPSLGSSQIGTFLSTILKQNYSASMTCVFSASKPSREKQRLENKWKTIQSKEKRKEESLKDHAEKKKLIVEYDEIQDNVGWFNSSVYFVIKVDPLKNMGVIQESISGLIYSIWGGDDSIKLQPQKISQKVALDLIVRKHMKKQKMHVSRLVSFVNTPIRKLPIISPENVPEFQIPPNEVMSNEIEIGDTVFEGRRFSKAGLKIEWLRDHVSILGATGTGKTTLVKQIIAQISHKTNIPWWIFDIKGTEYTGLIGNLKEDILVLRPGFDESFIINLLNNDAEYDESDAYSTFVMLRELLKEKGESSELSPAMEKLLRESINRLVKSLEGSRSIQALIQTVSELAGNDRIGQMTKDALLNRLQILCQEPLGNILSGGPNAIDMSDLLKKRVILDLSYVARKGGMESARLLYNLISKHIFDSSMKRGIVPGLHHIVVLEEASNLVPESYSRHTSADVTTGESMVLLQRATGQGVIVISTRPNISSNILANTATKIVFRLPYDSHIGGQFLSLNQDQEIYLRNMKRGRALVAIPNTETFEIATRPFVDKYLDNVDDIVDSEIRDEKEALAQHENEISIVNTESTKESVVSSDEEEAQTIIFDKVGRFGNHIVAFLASENMATEQQIRNLILSLNPSVMEDDVSETIKELVTLGTIEREGISLVPGGFVYTLPDKGLEAVCDVIIEYVAGKLGIDKNDAMKSNIQTNFSGMIIEDKALLIIPEHLRASSIDSILSKIRHHMTLLGNGINEMFVIVRGSVAAAKLREILDNNDEFNTINVVSAFPSSLDSMIESLNQSLSETETIENIQITEESNDVGLIEAIHGIGPATSRAIQIRLWFGLIQDFVDLSNGKVKWETLLEFIETTALQSLKGRSAPLTADEGRRALTELLADEVLIALRINYENEIIDVEQGLWIINSSILQELKKKAIDVIENELIKCHREVSRNHGYYDLCAGNVSYVVFPNQQQLNTLLNLHSSIACRTCKSTQVYCILTASEYLEDNVVTPGNLIIKTMDDNISTLVI